MNNIAEGHGRHSPKAFCSFLLIARGSATEVASMLSLAPQLGYCDETTQAKLLGQNEEIIRILTSLAKKAQTK